MEEDNIIESSIVYSVYDETTEMQKSDLFTSEDHKDRAM